MLPFPQPARDHVRARTVLLRQICAERVKVVRGTHVRKGAFIPRPFTHLFDKVGDGLAQGGILFFAEVDAEQKRKRGRFFLIRLLEHRIQRTRLQRLAVGVVAVHDAEGRIDARRIEIGADEPPAEGMDGADLGERKRRELRLQTLFFCALALRNALDERQPQPVAHLRRRLVGEGDGKDAAHVRAAQDKGDQALDHDERLAAPRRGGDDDLSARLDRRALFLRQCHAHTPSFSFSARAMAAISAARILSSLRASPTKPHAPRNLQYLQLPS